MVLPGLWRKFKAYERRTEGLGNQRLGRRDFMLYGAERVADSLKAVAHGTSGDRLKPVVPLDL